MSRLNKQQLTAKLKPFDFQRWVGREQAPLLLSLFGNSARRTDFARAGLPNWSLQAFLNQDQMWFKSEKVFDGMAPFVEKFLKNSDIAVLNNRLDKQRSGGLRQVKKLLSAKTLPVAQQIALATELSSIGMAYIWVAHGLEHFLLPRLRQVVSQFDFVNDVDKYIGDVSLPRRKNQHALFEKALSSNIDLKKIAENFSWIKPRGTLQAGYTLAELKKMRQTSKTDHRRSSSRPHIPSKYQDLFRQSQQLVYLRTARTDTVYEIFFRLRPVWQRLAKHFSIPWSEFGNYSIQSLRQGQPQKFIDRPTMAFYDEEFYMFNEPLIKEKKIIKQNQISGTAAYRGCAVGRAKIVKKVSGIDKIKLGDILIAEMTFPSYVMAMKKAAGFVTDEGGLTCHAAIIAREMKKPCVIGTKIATKVFKDGDKVEVDATRGIVKKIK